MKCSKIIFFVICFFLFLASNIIFAGKNKENSTIENNKTLYEYYRNSFPDKRIQENFIKLIDFFNQHNVSLNDKICKLIIQCDAFCCTKFMLNIKYFFIHEKFQHITIQQFSEWFYDDQQLKTFFLLTDQGIKRIATHDLLPYYLSSLYKDFGFPNINEINIIFRIHRNRIQVQEKIVQDIVALHIIFTRIKYQLSQNSFNTTLDALTKPSHLLLTCMHDKNIIVTDRFLLWMGRIPYHFFERTCQKMLVFLNKLSNPLQCDTIVDMITKNHINSFTLCSDENIEYIASLEKINDIMMIQQGQGFPNSQEIKHVLEIKEIESMWPRLRTQFKGRGFSTLPTMLLFLKRKNQYDKKIEMYIRIIKINNPHIQWSRVAINDLHSMLYFLLSKDIKDILLLSNIFYNVFQDCSAVIYRTIEFFNYFDHNLISIRKFSGMLCSAYAIHIFIELPNNILQLFAKYEQSNNIMNFFQKENLRLLKRLADIINVIHRYSCFPTTYSNPKLNTQFTKLKTYWIIGYIAINLDKEKFKTQWHTTTERDFLPIFEALLEKNIIIDDRLYATLFNHRIQRKILCQKLTYLFSHHDFSQHSFDFFMNLIGDNHYYFKFYAVF